MLTAETLSQWHYMIFLLPFAVAALFLILSSVRVGHHGGHHGGHGHVGHAHAPSGHSGGHTSSAGNAPTHTGHTAHGAKGHHTKPHAKTDGKGQKSFANILFGFVGVGQAPLPIVLETFGMMWGFCGFWANQMLVHSADPTFAQMLPSLGIGLGGGLLGARVSSEIFARIMPKEETFVVSQQELFGMTGQVTFPVSAENGRIHIYDENGTLHDEICRVAPNHPEIAKGGKALVVDMDMQGRLIVEEIAS